MTTLHIDLLVLLASAGENGLPVETLLTDLRRGRHRALTRPQAEQACRDLADKTLAAPFESALGGLRWEITGRGKSALEQEGIA